MVATGGSTVFDLNQSTPSKRVRSTMQSQRRLPCCCYPWRELLKGNLSRMHISLFYLRSGKLPYFGLKLIMT